MDSISSQARGFTYIEILVVLGLISLIGGAGYLFDTRMLTRNILDSERDTLMYTLLMDARRSAVSNEGGDPQGVYIDTDHREYIRFSGTTFDPDDDTHLRVPFGSRIAVHVSPTNQPILFLPRSGDTVTASTTITLTHSGVVRTITVYEHGGIDW